MSDTAKELRDELRDAWSPDDVVEIVDRALARIEQLERGIERANTGIEWCDDHGKWVDICNRKQYESLLQLIEELGAESQ